MSRIKSNIIPHQKHQRFASKVTAFCLGVDCVLTLTGFMVDFSSPMGIFL
jgi:hypothetical protein